MKSITTVGRHTGAVISAVVFDRKDCYIGLLTLYRTARPVSRS